MNLRASSQVLLELVHQQRRAAGDPADNGRGDAVGLLEKRQQEVSRLDRGVPGILRQTLGFLNHLLRLLGSTFHVHEAALYAPIGRAGP